MNKLSFNFIIFQLWCHNPPVSHTQYMFVITFHHKIVFSARNTALYLDPTKSGAPNLNTRPHSSTGIKYHSAWQKVSFRPMREKIVNQ